MGAPADIELPGTSGPANSPAAPPRAAPPANRWLIVGAFAAIYFIWGSTYLFIRWAVAGGSLDPDQAVAAGGIPPFIMAGLRFLVPAFVLFPIGLKLGHTRPTWADIRQAAQLGVLMLAVGNGAVTWSSQHVPSSLVALMVGAVPMWVAIMNWIGPAGKRPTVRAALGLILGFAGIALLVWSGRGAGHGQSSDNLNLLAAAVLLMSTLSWSFGSVLSSRLHAAGRTPTSPLISGSIQMFAAGVVLLAVPAVLHDDWSHFHPERLGLRAVLSWAYLVVFGSIIAFTAYVWLLRVVSPAAVATYAYVNPVVAMVLGVTLGDERLTLPALIAGLIIVAGVAMIITRR